MRTPLKTLVAAMLVAIACLTVAAPAGAKTLTQRASAPLASGGSVTATLTYTPKSYYDQNITLTITRAGQSVFTRTVTAAPCGKECAVQGPGSVHAVDLTGSGEPVVIVDLYSGGAHCCSISNFYTFNPNSQTYRPYEYTWGDPGYRLEKLSGKYVFETADDRFAYAWTDYAASGLPIQYLSYDGAKLINITRQFPKQIAADAAQYLKAFRQQAAEKYSDTTGVIAAWAADEDELGKSAQVATFLNAQAAKRHLNAGVPGVPQNAKFVTALNRFLKKIGYLS